MSADSSQAATYSITAFAGPNGSIAPSGTITANSGSSKAFIVSVNSGYQVSNAVVDGSGVSLTNGSYTFSNVIATHTIAVSFSALPDQHPPVFVATGNKSVNESSALNFTVTASPSNGGTLTYSASNLPSGASFDSTSRTFSWTPTYYQSGIYSVIFTATDTHGVSASEIVTISVVNIDRPPVAEAGQDQTIGLPASANLSAAASYDPDNDPLTYSWSKVSGPGLVSFSSYHTVASAASFSQSGVYVIELAVSDGTKSSTDRITMTVSNVPMVTYTINSSANPNGRISPNGKLTVNSGSNQTFTLIPDPGYQTASVIVDNNNGSLTNSTYTFTNITANHTIMANFTAVAATISPSPVQTHAAIDPPVIISPPVVHDPPANVSVTKKISQPANKTPAPSDQKVTPIILNSPISQDIASATPPSIPAFIWSFTKEIVFAIPSFFQYAFDRVVSGVKNVLKL